MKITNLETGGFMVEGDVIGRLKANKWTLGVLAVGLAANLGLNWAGHEKKLSWHSINDIRTFKELVFSIIVGQSGKAVRKWVDRPDGDQEGTEGA